MQFFSEELKKSVLEHFQLHNASAQKKEQFLNSIGQLGNDIAINTILEGLSDSDCLEFVRLCEASEDTKAIEFARLKIPDIDKKIGQEIAKAIFELDN